MSNRITRQEMFKEIVEIISKRSTCLRNQVGALIEKDGRIISIGYNGPASGLPECLPQTESHRSYECMGPGCTRSIHAEMNAIAYAAKAGISVEGGTMYCSMSPCTNCAKLIINSGIKTVIYLDKYRDQSGIDLLKKAEISTLWSPPKKSRPDAVQIQTDKNRDERSIESWEYQKLP